MSTMMMWVIYKDPHDFPGEIMARRWYADANGPRPSDDTIRAKVHGDVSRWTSDQLQAAQLKAVRDGIQRSSPGSTRMEKHDQDDHAIMEIWL